MSSRQITIAIDAMGGENSPFKTLKGSEIFSILNKNVKLLFFGNTEEIKNIIKINKFKLSNYEIIHCNMGYDFFCGFNGCLWCICCKSSY